MVSILSEFFGILGVDLSPPVDFASLLPWLFYVFVSIAIVAFVFKMFSSVFRSICGRRWF